MFPVPENVAPGAFGLGQAFDQALSVDAVKRPFNAKPTVYQVNRLPLQPADFAPSKPGVDGESEHLSILPAMAQVDEVLDGRNVPHFHHLLLRRGGETASATLRARTPHLTAWPRASFRTR